MYLYDRKGSNIEVYSIEPNEEKINKYRKKQMEKIPENERILNLRSKKHLFLYNAVTNMTSDICNPKKTLFNKPDIELVQGDIPKHEQEWILDEYCNYGAYINKIIINKYSDEKVKSETIKRLLTTDNESSFDNNGYFLRVISVPEELFLLEMLLDKDFDEIQDKDIKEQIELFDYSDKPIETIAYSTISHYHDLGIVTNMCMNDLNKNIKNDQKVLKYIRK